MFMEALLTYSVHSFIYSANYLLCKRSQSKNESQMRERKLCLIRLVSVAVNAQGQ